MHVPCPRRLFDLFVRGRRVGGATPPSCRLERAIAMNAEQPASFGNEPDTEFSNGILVVIEGPGDKTVRPRPANLPRGWPRPQLSPSTEQPPPETPPAQK